MAVFSAYAYALPCTHRARPYFPQQTREGVFLSVEDEGSFGIGEYAPLLGMHSTTVDEAISCAQSTLNDRDIHRAFHDACTIPPEQRALFFKEFPAPLGYLLSMALFHMTMQRRPLRFGGALKLAALIETPDAHEAISLAQAYVAQGFRHLKIKVGGISIDEEVRKIKTIAAIAGSKTLLRLDANRKFSFDEASTFLSGLKRVSLEYFEEPTYDVNRLIDLHGDFNVKIAVDESFAVDDDIQWLIASKVSHLIIKPGRFSNLFATLDLVTRAKAAGLVPIFSHCFESEFSSAIFARMVDELDLHEHAHGIVVDGIFRQGVFAQPLRGFRGQLSLECASNLSSTTFLRSHEMFRHII